MKPLETIKWSPRRGSPRVPGTCTQMYGRGVTQQGNVHDWKGGACFVTWTHREYASIGYNPNYHQLRFTKDQDAVVRYAINKVIRKVFPIIPPYFKLRKTNICLEFSTADYTYMELNFMFRTLRAIHEQPSVLISCYNVAKQYPDLEAPWVLGLASVGQWLWDGTLREHCTYSHGTFNGHALSRARTFAHIADHKGKFFAGPLENNPAQATGRYNYYGISDVMECNTFKVNPPNSYSEALLTRDATNTRYNTELLVAAMNYVRKKHIAYGGVPTPITISNEFLRPYVPQYNEDANKRRIW